MKHIIVFALLISLYSHTYAGIYNDSLHNWIFPIKYKIGDNVSNYKSDITKAFELIQNNTCLNFTKNDNLSINESGITFVNDDNTCRADKIGKKEDNTTNYIYLSSNCGQNPTFIASLIFHTLGMFPEQTRQDRDNNVFITEDYLKDDTNLIYFNKSDPSITSDYDTHYDYGSVVQYSGKSFSKYDDKYTIDAFGSYGHLYQLMLGQKNTIPFNNYKLLNRRFCNNTCERIENQCKNGGYINPRKCNECICPYPFDSKSKCETLIKSDDGCPENTTIKDETSFSIKGEKKCYIKFSANKNATLLGRPLFGPRIAMLTVTKLNVKNQNPCARNSSMIEIKYKKDLDVMGLCVCNLESYPLKVTSESSDIYLFYNGKPSDSVEFKVTYDIFLR
uniref:Metalloendopeptidase n=1 Tax=Parastrongyloides trichosuri TaxID=131310 RepID=A0A0N4ZWJ0_PARTI